MIYFSYRDADEIRDQLEQIDASDEMMVLRPAVLPGDYGYPDLHITHLRYRAGDQEALIVCVTEEVMSAERRQNIVERVADMMRENNSKELC